MHILFGPENDARHIDPAQPGGYEWWYFDAISDDGNWALVAIYFLGTPMSPYYKAVVEGRKPIPTDWCGVFFSLHETVAGAWRERAYAYNLYRNGAFSDIESRADIGRSQMRREEPTDKGPLWRLKIEERSLWRGQVEAELVFEPSWPWEAETANGHEPLPSGVEEHTWVCVAPQCRVNGTIQTAAGRSIPFSGSGYHDHNFGLLPYSDIDIWYWGRALVRGRDGAEFTAIYYDVENLQDGRRGSDRPVNLIVLDSEGRFQFRGEANRTLESPVRNAYGLEHHRTITALGVAGNLPYGREDMQVEATLRPESGNFSDGPFYCRLPLDLKISGRRRGDDPPSLDTWEASGTGIGEVFRPVRLCGPIASRAMWSRMRRRRL